MIAAMVSVIPSSHILQGDPFMVVINPSSTVSRVAYNNSPVGFFSYKGQLVVLIGIPLNQKPGNYELKIFLKNGSVENDTVEVSPREKPVMALGIPENLGGNSVASAVAAVADLRKENKSLANLKTAHKALWINPFIMPLSSTTVTNPYGVIRQTDGYAIPHKGTDFQAPVGTPIHAMNSGTVVLARGYRLYGNTIVIDHGLGLETIYMHLSKINVSVGEKINQGDVIGLTGATGYAVGPHLHVSVRIGKTSIDPIAFLNLFH